MVDYQVHRFRFGNWMPSSIKSLAVDPFSNQLAIGREDGDIEIIIPTEKWNCQSVISGRSGFMLQNLTWSKYFDKSSVGRLFGISIRGFVFEVNLKELIISDLRDTHGGAAWCISASPRHPHIAIGCEDGAVRLFQYEGATLEYHRIFPTTGHRILSLAHHPTLPRIFAGCSDGTIRCFDELTHRPLFRMSGDIHRGAETYILSLLVLSDNSVVSGDNRGHVQIWDGHIGVLVCTFHQHTAEILTLACSPDEQMIFASGVDPKVTCLRKIYHSRDEEGLIHVSSSVLASSSNNGGGNMDQGLGHHWVYTKSHRPHSHDVFALAVIPAGGSTLILPSSPTEKEKYNEEEEDDDDDIGELKQESNGKKRSLSESLSLLSTSNAIKIQSPFLSDGHLLLSGGMDTKLCSYSVPRFTSMRPTFILPIPSSGLISRPTDPYSDLIFMKKRKYIDIWSSSALFSSNSAPSLSHQLLLRMEMKGESFIHSFACSPCGKILIVSTFEGVRAWYLKRHSKEFEDSSEESLGQHKETTKDITPIKILLPSHIAKSFVSNIHFSQDGRRVALYLIRLGKVAIFDILPTNFGEKGMKISKENLNKKDNNRKQKKLEQVENEDSEELNESEHSSNMNDIPIELKLVYSLNHNETVEDSLSQKKETESKFHEHNSRVENLEFNIRDMSFSADGQYLAVASPSQSVYIYDLDGFRLYWHLPLLPASVTTIQFTPIFSLTHALTTSIPSVSTQKQRKPGSTKTPLITTTTPTSLSNFPQLLFILLSNNSLFIFDTEIRTLSPFSFTSPTSKIPNSITNIKCPLVGMSFSFPSSSSQSSDPITISKNDRKETEELILYGSNVLVKIDLGILFSTPSGTTSTHNVRYVCPKRLKDGNELIKHENEQTQSSKTSNNKLEKEQNKNNLFSIVEAYRSLIHVSCHAENQLVVIENPWMRVLEQLPDTLYRKRYGT